MCWFYWFALFTVNFISILFNRDNLLRIFKPTGWQYRKISDNLQNKINQIIFEAQQKIKWTENKIWKTKNQLSFIANPSKFSLQLSLEISIYFVNLFFQSIVNRSIKIEFIFLCWLLQGKEIAIRNQPNLFQIVLPVCFVHRKLCSPFAIVEFNKKNNSIEIELISADIDSDKLVYQINCKYLGKCFSLCFTSKLSKFV